ncbi:MAG: type II toxin-antitoxin system VapC family toxin [Candidatus Bathyarchaeia archaeon]|jgi:predicted nucleic acid-binding protein
MKRPLLFDASSIFTLVRELGGEAPNKLLEGSTISLAYYELGNALWRECSLLKHISQEEAEKLLRAMYAILQAMDVVGLDNEDEGTIILDKACKFNITYYDSAYVAEACKSKKTLVTDDKKLAKAAEKAGVKTLTSRDLIR